MRAALLSAAILASCAPTAVTVAADAPPRRQHVEQQPMPDAPPRTTTTHPSRGTPRTTVGGGVTVGWSGPTSTPAGHTALVSWYGQGSRTANGQPFNPDTPTFAHRTMQFGTRLRFCVGSRCVEAVCTDRGPYIGGRTFDLSRGAFAALAPLSRGVLTVTWETA